MSRVEGLRLALALNADAIFILLRKSRRKKIWSCACAALSCTHDKSTIYVDDCILWYDTVKALENVY